MQVSEYEKDQRLILSKLQKLDKIETLVHSLNVRISKLETKMRIRGALSGSLAGAIAGIVIALIQKFA